MREQRPCTEPGKCKDCQGPILWVKTIKGKNMPVDVKPDPRGKHVLVLVRSVTPHYLQAAFYKREYHEDDRRNRYTCHWETCPEKAENQKSAFNP